MEKLQRHYKCMSDKKISKLKINEITNKESIILLWVTSPKLFDAMKIIEKWKFNFITILFTWEKLLKNSRKNAITVGNYTREVLEHLLLLKSSKNCSAKKFFKPQKKIQLNVIKTYVDEEDYPMESFCAEAERGEHSEKPEIIYFLIEKLFYNIKKIEIFSRSRNIHYESLGNEIEKFPKNFNLDLRKKMIKIQEKNSNILKKFKNFEETSTKIEEINFKIKILNNKKNKKRKRNKFKKKNYELITLTQFLNEKNKSNNKIEKNEIIEIEDEILSDEF